MKRLLIILLLATTVVAAAQHVLTARSRIALAQAGSSRRVAASTGEMLSAFVQVDNAAALEDIMAAGVTVNSVTTDVATVQIPREAIGRIATIKGVKTISLAQRLVLTNDSARIMSNVDAVHDGLVGKHAYTGKGVIVGMIDTGVDFNHINLCDRDGRSRVLAAYLPQDNSGVPPVVDGHTLPGSHYCTPDEIAALTTDNAEQSHGTHTTGTAAGSYRDNGWHGVAPDAHLVVCAMADSALTDVNVANSIKYIFDFARRENLPCVINMSLGSEDGPHDGTSMLCRLIDELSGPGRICVVSAANEGDRAHVLSHRFTSTEDTISTCLAPYSGSASNMFGGYVSAWSTTAGPHTLSFTAVSKSSGKELCSWTVPQLKEDDEEVTVNFATDPVLSQYFTEGKIVAANGVESCNGHYHTLAEIEVKTAGEDIVPGIRLSSQKGDRVYVWGGNGLVFTRYGLDGMVSGGKSMSISDTATGDSAISVGAYCSRRYMPLIDGTSVASKKCVVNEIAYYSGYGPDVRGISRPDVCAPGYSLVSSTSRYDNTTRYATAWKAPGVTVDGVDYTYASQYGTSMSTPVVAGAIALWLEINPKLGPAHVREILKNTSVRDSYTTKEPSRWGYGKLDVAAGVKHLLKESVVTGIQVTRLAIAANPCNGDFTVSGLNGAATVTVHDLQGRVVAMRHVDGDGQVQLSGILSDGMYIVSVDNGVSRLANRLIVKH